MSNLDQKYMNLELVLGLPVLAQCQPEQPTPATTEEVRSGRRSRRFFAALMSVGLALGVIDTVQADPAEATAGIAMQTSNEGDVRIDIPINGGAQNCSINYGVSTDYDGLSKELYDKFDAIMNTPLDQANVTQKFRNTLTNVNNGLQGYASGTAKCTTNQQAGSPTSSEQQPSQPAPNSSYPQKLPNGSTDYGDGPSKCGMRYCMGSVELPREGNYPVPKIEEQNNPKEHPFASAAARMTNNGIENVDATAESVDKHSDPITDPAKDVAEAVASCPYGWDSAGGCRGLPGNMNPWAIAGVVPNEAIEPFVIRKPSLTGSMVLVCTIMGGEFRDYDVLGELLALERKRATKGEYIPEFAREVSGMLDLTLAGYDPNTMLCYIEG